MDCHCTNYDLNNEKGVCIKIACVNIYQFISTDNAPLHSVEHNEAIDLNMALTQSFKDQGEWKGGKQTPLKGSL